MLLAAAGPLAAWLVVLLVVLETGLRMGGPFLPGTYRTGTLIEPDPVLGWRHINGVSTWTRTPEWIVRVDLGPSGRRLPEVPIARVPGTGRIAIIGDSFVEGLQVERDAMFASRLGAALRGPVEIIDEGVGGWGTDQETLAFETRLAPLRPDVVVLAFAVANDVWDNARALSERFEPTTKPYFESSGDALLLTPPAPTPLADRIQLTLARSAAVAMLKSGLAPSRLDPGAGRDQLRVLEVPAGEWVEAWRVTEAILARFARSVRGAGSRPLLVIVPEGCQVHADLCGGQTALSSSSLPQQRLLRAADALGMPAVDLLPAFRERAASGERTFFRLDPHWNIAGQRLAAAVVAPAVEAERR